MNKEIILTLESILHGTVIDAKAVEKHARAVRETMSVYLTQDDLATLERRPPMIVVGVNVLAYLWIPEVQDDHEAEARRENVALHS